MVQGINKYISKSLMKVIVKEQNKMKRDNRIKKVSFVKASARIARRLA
jgi:hypothetical protein